MPSALAQTDDAAALAGVVRDPVRFCHGLLRQDLWPLLGLSTNEGVRFQGFHGRVLIVVDEAPRRLRAGSQSQASASEVPLVRSGGVYTVPVQINGGITLDFVVDSGAAGVNIPTDVVMTLIHAKTIALPDFLPGATLMAPGWRAPDSRFA